MNIITRKLILSLLALVLFSASTYAHSESYELVIDVVNLDIELTPDGVRDLTSALVINQVFEGLVKLDKDLKVMPDIAKRWTISMDRKHYVFHLNDDVRDSSGRIVSGDAVKHYYEGMLRKHPDRRWIVGNVEGLDDYLEGRSPVVSGLSASGNIFEIRLVEPSNILLMCLASPLAKIGFKLDGQFIGTGPYRVGSHSDNSLVLVANESNVNGRRAHFKKIRFIKNDNGSLSEAVYDSSGMALVQLQLEDEVARYRRSGSTVIRFPNYAVDVLVMNYGTMRDDERVFLLHSTDNKGLTRVSHMIGVRPVDALIPMDIPGWKKLSIDRGTGSGKRGRGRERDLRFLISRKIYERDPVVIDSIMDAWRKKGIGVRLDMCEHEIYIARLYHNRFDVAYVRYLGDYPDPDAYYFPFLHSSGQFNFMRYNNRLVDKLLELSRVLENSRDRIHLYSSVNKELGRDPVVVPLFSTNVALAVNPKLDGISPNGQGIWNIDLSDISIRKKD
ncbi:MAG: ABC transporter substrate-binding protein [Proteobacteria bacterium]|nr:ABC transporter substrate-binding protein [Pseudomonadota bacterium]